MPIDKANRAGATGVTNQEAVRIVRCPGCGGESVYAQSNPFRPFCSERCKNMDFGAWASENFRMPTAAEVDEQFEKDPPLQ
jgi:endogenous inhibitor of DNA gyrase (YacG/DUF329 family)